MDRQSGQRGARFRAAEAHLIALTGAEDALVTNNNAAAVALALAAAVAATPGPARARGVAVARGELVEIGGGVRIPDVIRRAGLRLVEVGTTNRTRVADYREALESGAARAVLRVHPSNFTMQGFVEEADPAELAAVTHELGAVVVDDLGSGALLDTAAFGLAHEPTPMERLASGSDLVCFSGDKLVGGPQSGLVVGRSDLIARMRRDPLARAMRPDKVTLAGVAATLGLYRAGLATAEIPVWRAIAAPEEGLRNRAEALAGKLARLGHTPVVVPLEATVGGGSLPGETLPSWGLALPGPRPQETLRRLRVGEPAIVGRIEDDAVILDLRTVEPRWDEVLPGAIARALGGQAAQPGPYRSPCDGRRRHRRPHRPRQDRPPPSADRHRCRSAARGTQPRHDHRRRLRPHDARRRRGARLRGRARPRPIGRQHARRRRRDRRRHARHRGGRRPEGPDPRTPGAARRPGHRRRASRS